MIQAVLWDLDGTLISTRRLYLEAYRRALAPYLGRDMPDEEILAKRARSEIRFLRAQAADQYDACLRDFRRHYADLHATHFGGIYPGVIEALGELRRRGVKMGLVTGKSRNSYEVTIVTADLGPFDVLVMDDDVEEPKPHPQGMLIALSQLDVEPRRTIYVGDSLSDIHAAIAAGIAPMGALWSKQGENRTKFATAVAAEGGMVAETPADVLELMADRP
jgi:HAD superfamily hydrolase (TIGR01509 family)